jgi:hypothetical protein
LVKPDLRADRIGAGDWNQGKETGNQTPLMRLPAGLAVIKR